MCCPREGECAVFSLFALEQPGIERVFSPFNMKLQLYSRGVEVKPHKEGIVPFTPLSMGCGFTLKTVLILIF